MSYPEADKSGPIKPVKFIHIGHHKCGSTWFQSEVLPKIKALRQPPGKRPNGLSNLEFRRAFVELASRSDAFYDFESATAPFFELDYNCLSNEAFVGFGSREAAAGLQYPHIARRLHRLCGDTTILLFIRNQRSIIPSMYVDDVEYGYVGGFERWLAARVETCQLDWFRYSGIINAYSEVFGRDRVKVVLYEDLFRRETVEDILKCVGVPADGLETVRFDHRVNAGMTAPTVALSRVVHRVCGSRANEGNGLVYKWWIKKIQPALDMVFRKAGARRPEFNSPLLEDVLRGTYGADNEVTSKLIGIDLHARKYP